MPLGQEVIQYTENGRHESDVSLPNGLVLEQADVLFQSGAARSALLQLRAAIRESLAALDDHPERGYLPPALRRRRTDVHWAMLRGDNKVRDTMRHAEATIPASGLTPTQVRELRKRAFQSFLPEPRAPVGHYTAIQRSATVLADAVLRYMRQIDADVPRRAFFVAVQVSRSPAGAERTAHRDPETIAAALATFSLVGAATITLSLPNKPGHYRFDTDARKMYCLTGEALGYVNEDRPVEHAVKVGSEPRIAITLRFANADDNRMGSVTSPHVRRKRNKLTQ